MRTKIEVLTKDIRAGEKESISSCPVALAINRIVDNKVDVDCEAVYFKDGHDTTLPVRAQRFIKRFDRGASVKPFAFFLDLDLE